MITYLAGGINGLSDRAAKDWREYVKSKLGAENCLDPMRRDYRGREDDNHVEIVEKDKEDINASDIVLVNCAKPSWGTAMEILYAYETSAFVIAVLPEGVRPSPWIAYHADRLMTSWDRAIDFIRAYGDV